MMVLSNVAIQFFLSIEDAIGYFSHRFGEVPERLKGAVSKTVVHFVYRGFESHPLRLSVRRNRLQAPSMTGLFYCGLATPFAERLPQLRDAPGDGTPPNKGYREATLKAPSSCRAVPAELLLSR